MKSSFYQSDGEKLEGPRTAPAVLAGPGGGKARYIMMGGFLGAGKTTSVARLAEYLTGKGLRVGLITNDQGAELVDTAMLRSRGFATEEIAGGCFCCRFGSLVEAAERLTATSRPDVFIAEPVGSCTDLVATVSYPLRRIYGESFSVAPLSVVLDPVRAARVLGLEEGGRFSSKVLYIYRKQLEEADLIVINKCELLEPERLRRLLDKLAEEYPRAELLEVSARNGTGLEAWFEKVSSGELPGRPGMEMDYGLYGEGEALLGWLNGTARLEATAELDAEKVLVALAQGIQTRLESEGIEIAHLKMTLSPDGGLGGLAVVNLVRNDWAPELSQALEEPFESGELILNLRGEGPPETLRQAVEESLLELRERFEGLSARMEHLEVFRPGKPAPEHRFTTMEG
jgi:Ni2+-binding GTPase involved in maturation of urease and hydrogenase